MYTTSTRGNVPAPEILVKVVGTVEELMQAFVVRAAVFMAEQRCPYGEEFDGNDFSATHLIGYVDGEPAGTLRLRYFAGFAKAERAAVRKEFRGYGLNRALLDFAVGMVQRKGYTRLYGSAQKRLLSYWRSLGFEPLPKPEFHFSDHEYVPILRPVAAVEGALDEDAPDMVLNRREGEWDRPGVLEVSQSRLPTNPVSND
ncbi:MAG TPA: GNAT family N-acetyltransferase [Stellaceae bacterium]|nr:GNAT family N-acetyltransferase [Stellaceae bacterium]